MTEGQRLFWRGILAFARATRRGKNVDLAAASDALALEQELEARLLADEERLGMVAEHAEGADGR